MDSKYARIIAIFDTSVYDEKHIDLLRFFGEEFGQRRKIRTQNNIS